MYDHLLDEETLEVNRAYRLPVSLLRGITRLVVTRRDVLHALGLPSIGIKLDATPGRSNSVFAESTPGLYRGYCYELCGSGHRAMPINFLVV